MREKPAIEWGQLPAVAVDTNVATMLLNGALLCGQFQIKALIKQQILRPINDDNLWFTYMKRTMRFM